MARPIQLIESSNSTLDVGPGANSLGYYPALRQQRLLPQRVIVHSPYG
jgi:hypothetical protein